MTTRAKGCDKFMPFFPSQCHYLFPSFISPLLLALSPFVRFQSQTASFIRFVEIMRPILASLRCINLDGNGIIELLNFSKNGGLQDVFSHIGRHT